MSADLSLAPFTGWLATGERGISSETIVFVLTGVPITNRQSHPHDPSDFRRCERLLRQVPIARLLFRQMREVSPTWRRLVDEWDDLVALADEEVPGWIDGADGSAPRLFRRMQEIRRETTGVAS